MFGFGVNILTLVAVMLFCMADSHLECSPQPNKAKQQSAISTTFSAKETNDQGTTRDLAEEICCNSCVHSCVSVNPSQQLSGPALSMAAFASVHLFVFQSYFSSIKKPPIA